MVHVKVDKENLKKQEKLYGELQFMLVLNCIRPCHEIRAH
jgi:hypothetical protein